MPKPPKSPLDKPASHHSHRKPSHTKRTSSNEKSAQQKQQSGTQGKHGLKSPVQTSFSKSSESMSSSSTGTAQPEKSSGPLDAEGQVSGQTAVDPARQQQGRVTTSRHEAEISREGASSAGGEGARREAASPAAGEIERLREAVNSQMLLSQQRERLARHLWGTSRAAGPSPGAHEGRARVSPIHEENLISPSLDAAFASPLPSSSLQTASTESAKTVRGLPTPGSFPLNTPSYPFPAMKTPRLGSYSGHRPFTALSPTVAPQSFHGGSFESPRDHFTSGSVTPMSAMMFQPSEPSQSRDDPSYPTPNLYELALMLSAEPGLEAWWTTVVQICRDAYQAERVSLALPADSTDVENVPWGQKATFSALEEDHLSLTYLPRGSSLVPSSGDNDTIGFDDVDMDDEASFQAQGQTLRAPRPGMLSRHSFTAYENTKNVPGSPLDAGRAPIPRQPQLSRSKSYFAPGSKQAPRSPLDNSPELNFQSLEQHLAEEEAINSVDWGSQGPTDRENRGRVFTQLQAFDLEADPLIDSSGVIKVLDRGKVIALTRDYPYLDTDKNKSSEASRKSHSASKKGNVPERYEKSKHTDASSQNSSIDESRPSHRRSKSIRSQGVDKAKAARAETSKISGGSSHHYDERAPSPSTPKFEEYEQVPPSPWSQSPAPSPAIRADPNENPFFAGAPVDEDSFNPSPDTQDYSSLQQVETIGVDRSWTVLHIPLYHILLSKPVHSFRLDAALMEKKSAQRNRTESDADRPSEANKTTQSEQRQGRRSPIAILSIQSPIIPYPSNLRHSLEHLAPHLATSFSLCRHYTNIEATIAGMSRKRPQTTGFGALGPGGRPLANVIHTEQLAYSLADDGNLHRSSGGSITSPSDYSGVSRSTAGSPVGTPSYRDPGSVGLSVDKRSGGISPGLTTGDSYFNARTRPAVVRMDTGSAAGAVIRRTSKEAKESLSHESRSNARAQSDEKQILATKSSILEQAKHSDPPIDASGFASVVDDSHVTLVQTPRFELYPSKDKQSGETSSEHTEKREEGQLPQPDGQSVRRHAVKTAPTHATGNRQHTLLHSYGADFGSTFQSLPSNTASVAKSSVPTRSHSRAGSLTSPVDMPPPSDRLKSLMLDSLPAHVFVALPQTGEIVWVNTRYLIYRGQSVEELYKDPWASIHPDERDSYLKAWSHALRSGEQFSRQVRIRRFDGAYRWFYTRAVGSRDTRGVIVQWYGSHMDIHEQHIAEVKAARQEEVEASEAKHRLLANLIPQIIFAATENEGITFANEQWLSYTGQKFDDSLGIGFMDFVHPDDLAKCRIPSEGSDNQKKQKVAARTPLERQSSHVSSEDRSSTHSSNVSEVPTEATVKGPVRSIFRTDSSSSQSSSDESVADISKLARSGVIKISKDSNGRLSHTTEVRLRSKSGEYRWHLVRCVQVDNINFGGGDGSWFGACTDINDHKILETKLKEAMESKSKFLSNMSHEIRTPLIGISGMVSFLQDTVLNDEQMDYTNTIQTSATSLLAIINDILDLSKVDAGMMKLSFEWFHTRSLIEDANELVSSMAISKRLELNYVVDEDVPAMVKGDKVRIRQVLLNVIGNAIKFTSQGEVFSRCRIIQDKTGNLGQNEIMLDFSVVDTGRGFTKDEAELIFKPFSQIDGSSTRQYGGSGLGLVISRQLVELHGGQMHGSAVPNEGSTFTFTAKFGLPTETDHPESGTKPLLSRTNTDTQSGKAEITARAVMQAGGNPMLAQKLMQSPSAMSPRFFSNPNSPALASSASSDPSIRSNSTRLTNRSSASSINLGLLPFGEAAKLSSGENISSMKLALPDRSSSGSTPTQEEPKSMTKQVKSAEFKNFRPPMYSILVICPQTHSREATKQHIETTLPKDVPHHLVTLSSVTESQKMIGEDDPVLFTHIVLNLGSPEEIVSMMDQIFGSASLPQTSIIILSDPVQRQAVMKLASQYDYDQLAKENHVIFIYKPVKPSRFAVIFDPERQRDLSTDRNRSSAQQHVASQKQNYVDVEKRLGNKGHKVLLVEDNLVNQKVLLKFLGKVGIEVELALDGVECTDKVFSHKPDFYSLILCDLHMPRKDGYQTCREIREYEERTKLPRMPIIALSANVMADVLDKCVAAGFNNYVTKPVDFKALSTAMSDLLDPVDPSKPLELMRL